MAEAGLYRRTQSQFPEKVVVIRNQRQLDRYLRRSDPFPS